MLKIRSRVERLEDEFGEPDAPCPGGPTVFLESRSRGDEPIPDDPPIPEDAPAVGCAEKFIPPFSTS